MMLTIHDVLRRVMASREEEDWLPLVVLVRHDVEQEWYEVEPLLPGLGVCFEADLWEAILRALDAVERLITQCRAKRTDVEIDLEEFKRAVMGFAHKNPQFEYRLLAYTPNGDAEEIDVVLLFAQGCVPPPELLAPDDEEGLDAREGAVFFPAPEGIQ